MQNSPSPPPRRGSWFFATPLALWLSLAALFGGVVGLGGFTFTYAQGFSYLSNDPRACANCHIMREVFDGWNHGSHKGVAVCNDCHTPHDLIGKYTVKALNGFRHSAAFTLGGFPEPIRITPSDRQVAYDNCIRCHGNMVASILPATQIPVANRPQELTDCLRCHGGVGHGR
jgi:cytochrome c nitrite reductase small subunit